MGYGFNSTVLIITFFFTNRGQPLNWKIEIEDKRWDMCIQLVGDINQIFSFIMAHLHCEYSEKDSFCGLFAEFFCSYNVILFKGSIVYSDITYILPWVWDFLLLWMIKILSYLTYNSPIVPTYVKGHLCGIQAKEIKKQGMWCFGRLYQKKGAFRKEEKRTVEMVIS